MACCMGIDKLGVNAARCAPSKKKLGYASTKVVSPSKSAANNELNIDLSGPTWAILEALLNQHLPSF